MIRGQGFRFGVQLQATSVGVLLLRNNNNSSDSAKNNSNNNGSNSKNVIGFTRLAFLFGAHAP